VGGVELDAARHRGSALGGGDRVVELEVDGVEGHRVGRLGDVDVDLHGPGEPGRLKIGLDAEPVRVRDDGGR